MAMMRTVLSTSLLLVVANAASADWVEYADETAARLVADSGLGASDSEEKDYAVGVIDNDGDEQIDCDDSGCAREPACSNAFQGSYSSQADAS